MSGSVKPCDQRPDLLLARDGFSSKADTLYFTVLDRPSLSFDKNQFILFIMRHKRPPLRESKKTLSLFENSFCLIDESLDTIPDTLAYFSNVMIIRDKRGSNPDCRKGIGQAVRAKTCT